MKKEESVCNRIILPEGIKELSELESPQRQRAAAKMLADALREAGFYRNKKSR